MDVQAPVTVVIPYFDDAGTIGRALASVRAQTLPPVEVVVVDDGSGPDHARHLAALAGSDPAVRVIRQSVNRGPAAARNLGWDAARQPYVAFLDADDSWHPEKLERQLRLVAARPDAALVAHGGVVAAGGDVPVAALDHGGVRSIRPLTLLLRNQFGTPAVMVRSDLPFRFDPALRYAEDRDLWLRVLTAGRTVLVSDDQLAVYHKPLYGAGGLSGRLWRMERGELAVYRRLLRDGALSPALFAVAVTLSVAKHLRRLAVVAARRLPQPRVPSRAG
jgi:glycosyltransferase involved in cell wall biosynthesis